MRKFNKWLENVNDRVKDDVIRTLQQAKDRIGQYGSTDYKAASDADATLRGARGFLKIAHGAQVDQNLIFNLTRLANTCNGLSHLDPKKREKITQIQTEIDGLISILLSNSHTPAE